MNPISLLHVHLLNTRIFTMSRKRSGSGANNTKITNNENILNIINRMQIVVSSSGEVRHDHLVMKACGSVMKSMLSEEALHEVKFTNSEFERRCIVVISNELALLGETRRRDLKYYLFYGTIAFMILYVISIFSGYN